MTHVRNRWIVVVMVAVMSAWGAGCSDSGSPSDTASVESIDSVFGRREDNQFLHLAEQTLISRCMQGEGFEYRFGPLPDDTFEEHPYGNDDVERSRADGYGLTPTVAASPTGDAAGDDPNADYLATLSAAEGEAFTVALFGPPNGEAGFVTLPGGTEIGFPLEGCLADARAELYADGKAFMTAATVIDNLGTEVQTRVIEDDVYLDALDGWRECMLDRGYAVQRPGQAVEIAITNYETHSAAEAKEHEIEIATADAECSRSTTLVTTGEEREVTVWREVLDNNTGVIEAYRELREPALDRAKEIVGS